MTKLSIIVPVYNVEEYIRPCIESIFKQGLDDADFELIIVNDGTQDRSMEVIADIISQHHNITIINQENQGLSVARNNGIAVAKGEYILMPDSDDLLIENHLKPLLEKALETNVDLVLADFFEMNNEEIKSFKFSSLIFTDFEVKEKSGEEMFFEYLRPNMYTVWRTLWKKDFLLLHQLNFVPGIYGQDKVFVHNAYLKATKCLVILWPFYIYRRHKESISISMTERYAKDYCIVVTKIWELSFLYELSQKQKEKMQDYAFQAFSTMVCRLVHEMKNYNEMTNIIDYFNIIAPHVSFQHNLKQKTITTFVKKIPHIYILIRFLYGIICEDKILPFLTHHIRYVTIQRLRIPKFAKPKTGHG